MVQLKEHRMSIPRGGRKAMNAFSICCVVVFMLLVVRDSLCADQVSPCPRILRWRAVLELKSREGSEGIWLNIALDSKADVLVNTFGPVTSLNNQNFQINNPEYTLLPGAVLRIRITVKYNKNAPTPNVVGIKLNGIEICDEFASNNSISENPVTPGQKPTVIASIRKTFIAENKRIQCGLKTQVRPLVYNGKKAEEYWPWHIAVMILKNSKFDYHCGGTLVSSTSVLTAAHCVTVLSTKKSVLTAAHCVTVLSTKKMIDKDLFLLYMGLTHISDPGPYFKLRLVKDIVIHKDFDPGRYFNDLAVVEINDPVEFSDYIKPICLWDGDLGITSLIGQIGTVVGWGIDNSNETAQDLMEAKMPIVALETCLYHDPNFFSQFTSPKTFCAGGPNGSAVCTGDSGGGMVFPRKNTQINKDIWYIRGIVIRGIVSVSPRDGDSVCNTKNYAVFTDIAQHLAWIKGTAGVQ
ncbi:Serine protease gd N-terminus [Popillia japonica]|uniref:Serine protease gd N-terminus n=1 Tax=Popillia japonica TaxID=7064 RepID=A0AAW1MUL3_POPJA